MLEYLPEYFPCTLLVSVCGSTRDVFMKTFKGYLYSRELLYGIKICLWLIAGSVCVKFQPESFTLYGVKMFCYLENVHPNIKTFAFIKLVRMLFQITVPNSGFTILTHYPSVITTGYDVELGILSIQITMTLYGILRIFWFFTYSLYSLANDMLGGILKLYFYANFPNN